MKGQDLKSLIESLGPEGFYHKVCGLLNEKQISSDDFSYYELAEACGVLPHLRRLREFTPTTESIPQLLRESNRGSARTCFRSSPAS